MHLNSIWAFLALASSVTDAQRISNTARCGSEFGLTCQGSRWGNCCSQYSYCGSTPAYCAEGCQKGWGTCNSSPAVSSIRRSSSTLTRSSTTLVRSTSSRSSSAPAASSTLKVTPNARCGKGFGFTCQGSQWGDCCSQYSYCGSTPAYCGVNCQQGFGKCNAAVSPVQSSTVRASSTSSAQQSSSSSSVQSSSSAVSSTASSISSSVASSSTQSLSASSSAPSSSDSATASSLPTSSSTASSSSVSSAPQSSSTSLVPSSSSAPVVTPTPSTSCSPTNRFTNPGFETGDFTPWIFPGQGWLSRIYTAGSLGHDSARSLQASCNTASCGSYGAVQSIQLTQDTPVQVSVWINVPTDIGGVQVSLYYDTGIVDGTAILVSDVATWVRVSFPQMTLVAGRKLLGVSLQTVLPATVTPATRIILDDFEAVPVCESLPQSSALLASSTAQSSSISVSSTTPAALPSSSSLAASQTPSSSSVIVATSSNVVPSSSSPSPTPTPVPSCPSQNLIINPGFEGGPSLWSSTIITWFSTVIYSGGGHNGGFFYRAHPQVANAPPFTLSQSVFVRQDTVVQFAFYLRMPTYAIPYVVLTLAGVEMARVDVPSALNVWTRVQFPSITLPAFSAGDLGVRIYPMDMSVNDNIDFDDFEAMVVCSSTNPQPQTTTIE